MTIKENSLVNAVIEIDEVEYLINEVAVKEIERKEGMIRIRRLIDRKEKSIPLEALLKVIKKNGIVDHL